MLEAHYRAIADEGDLPIVVYNVPSRTGTNVDADTFLRLAEHPRVVAVKEASGNLEQIARICRDRPRDVAVLAGDDAWTLPILAMGGDGVVSVASNEIPGELVALCAAAHGRRLGRRPPDPRALAAAVPRQLPRRPEPGPGEGRARADGPARHATRSARRSCRSTRMPGPRWPSRSARSGSPRRPAAGSRRGSRRPARPWHDRRRWRRHRDVPTTVDDARSTTSRPGASAPPSRTRTPPTAGASGPRSRRPSWPASRDRTTATWSAGPLTFRDRAARPAARPGRRAVADRARRHRRPARRPPRRRASSSCRRRT